MKVSSILVISVIIKLQIGVIFRFIFSLDMRVSSIQCDYQATYQSNLLIHIQSKHEGIKYPCNQCDYQATRQSSLQRHIESRHEGIKYPCNQCDYLATQQDSLQTHIAAKHSDRILKCDDCDFQTKWRTHYIAHKKTHA